MDVAPSESNNRVIAQCVRFNPHTFFVPREQPLHLLFLRLVFNRLRAQSKRFGECTDCDASGDRLGEERLPMEAFHRAFDRLFFVLQDPLGFNAKDYDENGDGDVTWSEFFKVYNQRNITVKLSLCERIYLTFDDPDSSVFATIVSSAVLFVIVISSLCFILSTVDEFQLRGDSPTLREAPTALPILRTIDLSCLLLFVIEYLVRLATCWNVRTELFRKTKLLNMVVGFQHIYIPSPAVRVLKFVFNPTNLIDLAAIMPGVLSLFMSSANGGLVVLRLIRLTRIFRAFKSPALVEPVIIIGRTLHQSTKALYFLAFNLMLGVAISGSLMYLAEGQGDWDVEQQRYVRWVGWEWNATTESMNAVMEVSPFQSIPHTFWWAMVTITTVGYGDEGNFPRTGWGYIVTVLTMVFSLVMLALPVGVIGSTFSQVWSEFDREKAREAEMVQQELSFVTTSLQRLDPEQMSRMILIEVWDDHNPMGDPPTSNEARARASPFRFLGEAKMELDLPGGCTISREQKLQLQPNMELVNRKVTGEVTVHYRWTPAGLKEILPSEHHPEVVVKGSKDFTEGTIDVPELQGTLEVTIVRADHLINICNTNGQGASNPYCVVFVYPTRPAEGAILEPATWCTPTVHRSLCPVWQVSHIFQFDWTARHVDVETPEPQIIKDVEKDAQQEQSEAIAPHPESAAQLNEVLQMLQVLTGELRSVKDEVRTIAGRLDWLSLDTESKAQRKRDERHS